ncbi:hypothetical protein CPB85DRAFT_842407 [Mucidula mucida]|nr:hypothetical protein CPB85DRAFT_842407 [Mucidula mucida]
MVPYLSNELIDQIFCFLNNEQLKVVRFASIAFSQIAAPFLFESLVVDFYQVFREVKRDNKPLLEFMQAIGNGKASLGRHIRRLHVVTPLDVHTQEGPLKTLGSRMARWSKKENFQDIVIKALVTAAPKLVELRTLARILGLSFSQQFHSGIGPDHSIHTRAPLSTYTVLHWAYPHPSPISAAFHSHC